jgi:hypothetical protein
MCLRQPVGANLLLLLRLLLLRLLLLAAVAELLHELLASCICVQNRPARA